ncbi:hypothetical protein BCR41DRAFT_372817 [Lobosporangium transversale]|uniref:Uncharacterized protein n=1 Tax=Lobosporangium transversale TaxID=64571 RepID=A0A1Y2GHG0_9FUNG|nr:hypothetical protein BCR41DRAFT_372817 [Lobosporangium transversale]ORZ09316.1 hypothetical protein BCR41DRAFT_372817 [Lobosporangium transversale]|eukprot:XP_021878769.1 hypothetical protein BCR41DRAFT_372817 [Lobosporangium transversale]
MEIKKDNGGKEEGSSVFVVDPIPVRFAGLNLPHDPIDSSNNIITASNDPLPFTSTRPFGAAQRTFSSQEIVDTILQKTQELNEAYSQELKALMKDQAKDQVEASQDIINLYSRLRKTVKTQLEAVKDQIVTVKDQLLAITLQQSQQMTLMQQHISKLTQQNEQMLALIGENRQLKAELTVVKEEMNERITNMSDHLPKGISSLLKPKEIKIEPHEPTLVPNYPREHSVFVAAGSGPNSAIDSYDAHV